MMFVMWLNIMNIMIAVLYLFVIMYHLILYLILIVMVLFVQYLYFESLDILFFMLLVNIFHSLIFDKHFFDFYILF